MALGNMVPGSGIDPDWRAIGIGAAVLGTLCLFPVLGGWIELPSTTGYNFSQEEGPGLTSALVPFLIGAPGSFVAGFLARSSNLRGAVEGVLCVPIGAVVPVVAGIVDVFLLFEGTGLGWQIEYAWRGAGVYAVIGVMFVPLACALGGVLGWLGAVAKDAASGNVRIAWS